MFSAEKHFLERSEGTSSFYVKDYTSVDTNITRHLAEEFGAAYGSWDILLLHYLGLDHIGMVVESQASQLLTYLGHSLGGRDPEIHVKLREMDNTIEGIVKNIVSAISPFFGTNYLLVYFLDKKSQGQRRARAFRSAR